MTKAEIVDAAFKVWGRSFYQNTSLSELARELKVSKPALYRHFRNKQALMDAMTGHYFDDFTAFVKDGYEQAINHDDRDEGISIMIGSITEYYARNVYAHVFSLMNIFDLGVSPGMIAAQLKTRGLDMEAFHQIVTEKYAAEPLLMQLIWVTQTFFMVYFHKTGNTFKNAPSEEEIQNIITLMCKIIIGGIRHNNSRIDILNFEEQESRVAGTIQMVEIEPLLKAVAAAVADAGPWGVSMDMAARKSGLSKSSLYGHFKNKRDMLGRLFIGEFKRILAFARQGINLSQVPEEQLYLGIFSIATYLRSRPEILITMNWLRTRRLDLGKPRKQDEFFRLFEDVDIAPSWNSGSVETEKRLMSHWILFLLVNVLSSRNTAGNGKQAAGDVQNRDIRALYRFITLGLEGFQKEGFKK